MTARSVKGTETEKNLLKNFAGESQARNRYSYFASAARKEGYLQIADIFEETAEQERMHAKQFFKYLEGGTLEITACYPAGKIGTTEENLIAAAAGEHEEWSELYPAAAEVAKQEGFNDIAATYRAIVVAENHHEKRYKALLKEVRENSMFEKAEEVEWTCMRCGYVHKGTKPPKVCPACKHPTEHYILLNEKY